MELKRYLKIIQSWWWLVLVSFLTVFLAGFAFSFTRQPVYQTSITMIVGPRNSITDIAAVRQTLDTLDNPNILNTYAEVMRSSSIYQQALESTNLASGEEQPAKIQVDVIQNTNLIKIDAEGSDPLSVYQMGNAVADNGMKYVNELYQPYEIKVLDAAAVPTRPSSPDVPRDAMLSAVLGLVLGVTLSFLAEYIKKPLESLEQMSIMDRDSSLYNRSYFLRRLKQELNRMKRNMLPLTICMIELTPRDDVDNTYSKQIIQTVRRRANAYLKRHIRQNEILARWDGDTLAWLMLDTGEASATQGIERLSGLLDAKLFEDDETGVTIPFSAVIGAVVAKSALSEKELLALCEQTLRQAKAPGGDSILIKKATDSVAAATRPAQIGKAV